MAQDKPTTIRPTAEMLARVEYLKKQLDLRSLSAVLWYCVNRVYRDEQAKDGKR